MRVGKPVCFREPMLFNSFEFAYFLTAVFVVYYAVGNRVAQVAVLIIASLWFYAAKTPVLVALLGFSILVNTMFGWLALNSVFPRLVRLTGVCINLGLLAYYKYGPLIWPESSSFPVLPIGISFYTFEGIMILFDRSIARPTPVQHAGRVALLMSFFPHLVSGPIVKAEDFFPQIERKILKRINWELVFRCLVTGYFLKMVVADNLRQQSNRLLFPQFESYSSIHLAALLLAYSGQIFADFAGYSLIAVGLAAMFGYRLPQNFNYPYLSASFSEFWRRWHISLSTFLRDYLFIPLGGSRHGRFRTFLNILIVMGLGGLWHGAAWSYAIWGLAHGVALVGERMLPKLRGLRALRVFLVFLYVTFAWLLFRMPHFDHVVAFLKCLTQNYNRETDRLSVATVAVFLMPVLLYHLKELCYPDWLRSRPYLIYGTMLFLILTNSGPSGDFIYFQF